MTTTIPRLKIDLPMEEIAAFCERWQITELSVFGSVLRDDFRADSDVDFLVSFGPEARGTLLDLVEMEEELGSVIGRKVDLVLRSDVERSRNWIRRQEILQSVVPVVRMPAHIPTSATLRSMREDEHIAIAERTDTRHESDDAERRRMTRTRANLLDAITFSEELIQFTAELGYDQFIADTKTRYAVLHLFTLLGEVVRKLPTEMQDAEPDVPWKKIIGMRNIIVHNYTDVDLYIVWEAARDDLPAFLATVQRLFSEYSSSSDEEVNP